MKSLLCGICCILSLAISSITPIYAGETGHYGGGVEGIKAATIPPPDIITLHTMFFIMPIN